MVISVHQAVANDESGGHSREGKGRYSIAWAQVAVYTVDSESVLMAIATIITDIPKPKPTTVALDEPVESLLDLRARNH